jgi:ribosome-associated toxin RatA of RatAB toxin-antitoxin module
MAKASRTETYDVPASKFYQAIIDYKNYNQFVPGVDSIEVLSSSEEGATVKFNINVIKKISYTLKLTHKKDQEVSWSLVTGDYMKTNNGKWALKDLGGNKTEVAYTLEIEVKGFIPGLSLIEKGLVETNLPMTMSSFAKRAENM